MAVISLTEYKPLPRFDGKAWQKAKVQGAKASSGPWTLIEEFSLSPVDSDPTKPAARSFTTEKATAEQTYVRVVFVDADGDEQATDATALSGATSSDLTTVSAVRAFLQKKADDTTQDAIIASLITRASAAIASYTERQFTPETGATHVFEIDQPNGSLINFAPYELRSLTSIELDTDSATPTTLTTEEYRLWPKPNPDGTYLGVKLRTWTVSPVFYRWGTRRELSVKGDWGLASVPADIEHWCIVTVAIWLRREVAAFASGMKIDEGYVERPQALPSSVRGGLDQWKRYALP